MPPLNTGRNGGEPTSVEPDSDVTVEPARKRREFRLPVLSRVSIQSKLLVMLLITSVLSRPWSAISVIHRAAIRCKRRFSTG